MAKRNLPPLTLLVFVVGASTLGAEIAAARLLAPFFGASTIVWANTIAIVLVALSAGYWFGGRMADRHPHMRGLCVVVLIAAGLLALVPIVADPFLSLAVKAFDRYSVGAFAGSLFGVLVLVALPVLLLGAVAPWAIRLKMARIEDSGETAGRLYAISTIGSLVGTFLSALVMIPLLGTQRTFLAFAAALAVTAALGVGRRWMLAPVAVVALLIVPPGMIKASGSGRVIYETETPYQYARVVQLADGERHLELNEGEAIHSIYRPDSVLTGNYWDGFLTLPFATHTAPIKRIALLGNGAGTVARAYGKYFPETKVDAVEIDGRLFDIGRRFFGLEDRPELKTITADARPFLRSTKERYDAIFVDAYQQPYIPFYLTTREFFKLTRERLNPEGVVIINVGHPENSTALEKVLSATVGSVFPHVMRDPMEPTNTLLIASKSEIDRGRINDAVKALPLELRQPAKDQANRLSASIKGGTVYTDDRAPVEWLIDKSIVQFAAGEVK